MLGSTAMRAPRKREDVSPAHLVPSDLCALEAQAQPFLSEMAFDYIRGGAGDEITVRANRLGYDRLRLIPRVLVDVSQLDLSVELLGAKLRHPILLAPAAFHRLFHPDGELATARAANATGTAMSLSTYATTAMEEVLAATQKPVWMQLYVNPDRGLTRALVERATAAGCQALCLTVDTPVLGCWYGKKPFVLPEGLSCPNTGGTWKGAIAAHRPTRRTIYAPEFDAAVTWKDIAWLRSITSLPLVLKGILNPDDAARAAEEGADALIVSNHGGRNLDTVPPTIDMLPRVVKRAFERSGGKLPVLVDGGIRRGTDILKALALGATAVLIGRPYLYGLAIAGEDGVRAVIEQLRAELEMAMALCGRKAVSEIDASVIHIE
jgi:4-hydroxymandelate oxidase